MKFGSKKLLLGAIVVSGALLFFAIKSASEQTYESGDQTASLQNFFNETAQKDSDSDGLKDWEETLWKTSADKADTDGDGVSDGEEIALGRNPTIPGPNDVLEKQTTATSTLTLSAPGENLTVTDEFARKMFAVYIAKKQQGEEISSDFATSLIDDFISQNGNVTNKKVYALSELFLGTSNDEASLRQYGNTVGQIITPDTEYTSADTLNAILLILEKGDNTGISILQDSSFMYEKMRAELLALKVPPILVNEHLALLNSVESLYEDVNAMLSVEKDPVQTLFYVRRYTYFSIMEALVASQKIGEVLVSKNVVFQQSEDGYVLMPAL